MESARSSHVLVCSSSATYSRSLRRLLTDHEVRIADHDVSELDGIEVLVWHEDHSHLSERLRDLAALVPTVAIADTSVFIEAVEMGCRGFISSDASLEETARAIATVLNGEAYVPPLMLGALLRHIVAKRRSDRTVPGLEDLTPRELDVYDLARKGAARTEIAERLFISPGTVRTHLQSVYKKLGVHTQAELAALASGSTDLAEEFEHGE